MRSVEFKKVGMQNFCCYTDLMEFEFKNDKIVMITGPNGSGKTTIFDSIPYTFYGITPKNLKGDDVVNNVTGKDCYTYVEFDIDKDHYKCERYCKYTKIGNTATLSLNGKKIKKGHNEVVAEIERILLPQKLFSNTISFGQKVKAFFTDLPDSEQKEIFRRVLQLDDYQLYYDEVNKRLKGLEENVINFKNQKSINEGLLEEIQKQIEHIKIDKVNFYTRKKADLDSLNKTIFDFGNTLTDYSERYSKFGDKLESEKEILLGKERELKSILENAQNKLESEILSIRDRKKAKDSELNSSAIEAKAKETQEANKQIDVLKDTLYEKTNKLEDDVTTIRMRLEKLDLMAKVNTNRISNLESERDPLVGGIADSICPLCKQSIQKHTVEEIQSKITEINKNIDILKSDVEKIKEEIRSSMTKKDQLTETINSIKKEIGDEIRKVETATMEKLSALNERLKDKLRQLLDIELRMIEKAKADYAESSLSVKHDIVELQPKIEKLNTKILEKQKYLELINEVKAKVKATLETIAKKETEEYDNTFFNTQIEKEKEVKRNIEKCRISLSEIEDKYDILRFWKSGFSMSGIPSMLIDETIPFMNKRIMEYLDAIGGRYIVSFDTLGENKSGEVRDKITIRVLDTVTKANMRKQLSGGQTRIIDIATILTLSDLQNIIQNTKMNIILLDEIFDSLDDKNISYVSNLLRSLTKGKSTNIISHRAIDLIDCDEVLQLF